MRDEMLDVLIVGGGMVGASLALAFQHSDLRVGLIEAQELHTHRQPSYDDRGIALSHGSQRILSNIGIWPDIAAQTTAITHIHVSDKGHFGVTRLAAEKEQVPALGYVLTARQLGESLNMQLQQQPNLQLFCPAQIIALQQQDEAITVTLNDKRQLRAKLLVAADGRDSTVRQLLQIHALLQDYNQTAVTANISTDKPHQGWAYERFTDTGPLALLPMSENRSSLIWTVKTGDEQALLNLSDRAFLHTLQQRFGYRAGRFIKVGQRRSHPLTLLQADSPVQQRVVLIGNAAHSLHPIAGQGFNLGLRDVAALAQTLLSDTSDAGDPRLLQHYQSLRQSDQDQVVNTTDQLVRLFSNAIPPLAHGRGAGLALLDILPPAKSWLARSSMGLSAKLLRLARGAS